MVQIKEAFKTLFKQSLEKFIAGDTSGDYKKLLVAVVDWSIFLCWYGLVQFYLLQFIIGFKWHIHLRV